MRLIWTSNMAAGSIATPVNSCDMRRQPPLLRSGCREALDEGGVVGEGLEPLQTAPGSSSRRAADRVGAGARSVRVGLKQPAAKADAVGLVDDAARPHGVERVKHGLAA